MDRESLVKLLEGIALDQGARYRHFEPGTRADTLISERDDELSKRVKVPPMIHSNHEHKTVPMDLIVRGGRSNGKLD